jgi:hypothetical protein
MSCYHGFSKLPYSSEVPGVWHFLNALEYNYMDKNQKKKLCPNDISLGFGVPSKVGGWDMDEPTSEWRTKYGPKIFCGDFIQFSYVLNIPPFFKVTIILKKHQTFCPCPSWIVLQLHFIF